MNNAEFREQDYHPTGTDIVVEQGEWAVATQGEALFTAALGPCIGIALYDPVTSTGYLAHMDGAFLDEAETIAQAAVSQSADISLIKVWLTGALTMPESKSLTIEARSTIVRQLTGLGLAEANITTEWLQNPDEAASVLLDTLTGQCNIIFTSMFDYSDGDNLDSGNY